MPTREYLHLIRAANINGSHKNVSVCLTCRKVNRRVASTGFLCFVLFFVCLFRFHQRLLFVNARILATNDECSLSKYHCNLLMMTGCWLFMHSSMVLLAANRMVHCLSVLLPFSSFKNVVRMRRHSIQPRQLSIRNTRVLTEPSKMAKCTLCALFCELAEAVKTSFETRPQIVCFRMRGVLKERKKESLLVPEIWQWWRRWNRAECCARRASNIEKRITSLSNYRTVM